MRALKALDLFLCAAALLVFPATLQAQNASLSVDASKSDPGPAIAGSDLSFTINVNNEGPANALNVVLDTGVPAPATFVSMSVPAGFVCGTLPPAGGTGPIQCSGATLLPGTATFTLVLSTAPSTPRGTTVTLNASVSATSPDPGLNDNSVSVQVPIEWQSNLSIVKSGPTTAASGETLTYTITITNPGPSFGADLVVDDVLPAGLFFVSASGSGWSCTTPATGTNGAIQCTNPQLALGSTTLTLAANTLPSDPGQTITNEVAVNASTDPAGPRTSAITTTVAPRADLTVTKTVSPLIAVAGQSLTYTVTVTNNGPSDAASVVLTDTLPAAVQFQLITAPAGWSCSTPATGSSGTISCSLAVFPAGSAQFTIQTFLPASTPAGTAVNNAASATAATPDPATPNSAAVNLTSVSQANLGVTISDTPDPVVAGTSITYAMTVTNAGPSKAPNTTLSIPLPASLTLTSMTPPAGWSCTATTCSHPSLAPGASAAFTLVAQVAASATGTITVTATAASAASDPSSADNSATATTTVTTQADLGVTISDTPDPVIAGTALTYAITVTNAGPSNAASVTLSVPLPASLTLMSMTPPAGWSCSATTCTHPSLAPGTSASFTMVTQVAASASGTIATTATVTSPTLDPTPAGNSATASTTVTTAADLGVTISDSPDPVVSGQTLTYTIVVTNAGASDAANPVLSFVLPSALTLTSVSATGWSCGTTSCTKASLAAGAAATFTLTARVAQPIAGGSTLATSVSVTSSTTDPAPANNSAGASTTALSPATVTITKRVSSPAYEGYPVTYTITLTNGGPATQGDNPGDEMVDVLPSGVTLVSATASSGTALAALAQNRVTWNGSIAPGGSVVITINATANANTVGTALVNQATANYDADGNGTNEASASASASVTPFSGLAIPALSDLGLLLLGIALATLALRAMR
jgi:uncharacterized repeat protein (TIGR01451 family)